MRALAAFALVACSSPASSREPIRNVRERNERRTKPTLEEAQAAVAGLDGAALGTPLWFDGFRYSSVHHDDLSARCTATSGTLYTTAELTQFAECLVIADWRHSDTDSLEELEHGRFPIVFHKHRVRIAELATDHLLAYSHFCPAAPGDFWTLFAVGKDSSGRVLVDAILVANEDEADCRTVDNGGFE